MLKALSALALAIAPATAEQPSATLQATGQWTLEYADNSCVLSRSFGTGPQALTLGFRLLPNMLSSDGVLLEASAKGAAAGRAIIVAQPDGMRVETRFRTQSTKDGQRMSLFALGASDIEALSNSEQIKITLAGREIALAPRGIRKAIDASEACLDDLLTRWNIDPAINANVVTKARPVTSPANWVTDDDYPSSASFAGNQGTVTFRLDINAKGNPANCMVLVSSGHALLNETACALMMKRSRFKPARTADGSAVPYFFISRMTWLMPS